MNMFSPHRLDYQARNIDEYVLSTQVVDYQARNIDEYVLSTQVGLSSTEH